MVLYISESSFSKSQDHIDTTVTPPVHHLKKV